MNKYFQNILNLAQSGHLTEALKKCDLAIKKKPKDINYLLLAASLYAQNDQFEEVKAYCLRACRIEPKNVSALYNLGVACLFLQDYVNTIKYSLLLIKQDKKHAKAYANLGWLTGTPGDLNRPKKMHS